MPSISEVNANSVCLFICRQPTGLLAHAQKLAKHMFVSASHRVIVLVYIR